MHTTVTFRQGYGPRETRRYFNNNVFNDRKQRAQEHGYK